ncbi:MAG: rhamnulokinase [Planctomycetales bacterium]|nr:rhamnulokinase [Planctomycetales bacterium]
MSTETNPVHLAIDLGASGGRVLAGHVSSAGIALEQIHRFPNEGLTVGNRLVWNLLGQWQHVLAGLNLAAARYGSRVRSVGADTWGVDYVLLDRNDDLVGPCYHYRDSRTVGLLERAFQLLSRKEIFEATGIQFMEINTLIQLFSMREENSPLLDIAEHFLMIPDFLHWQLSGEKINEFTNASTTQMLSADQPQWSDRILKAFDIPTHLFSPPQQPGISLGPITPNVSNATGLHKQVETIVPATHDTGSAVLAVPADTFAQTTPDWCYISCGTWSLMGAELARPVLTPECQLFNFTNEGGVLGSVRLLKNIAGLWIVQQCAAQWKREGRDWSWERMIQMAESAPTLESVIDTDDPMFVAPINMPEAVREYCKRTGQPIPETEGAIFRCALESLALRYRLVLGNLEQLVGQKMKTIYMVGGGVQNRMLCQFAADACQLPVVAGPVEATALGNIIMQAIGTGELDSVIEARKLLFNSAEIKHFEPRSSACWDAGFETLRRLTLSGNR